MVVILGLWFLLTSDNPFGTESKDDIDSKLHTEAESDLGQQGLLVRFTEIGDGERRTDVRTSRLAALYVGVGEPVTPFLEPGPFEAVWEGRIEIEVADEYRFYFEGTGTAELSIDGNPVLKAEKSGERAASDPMQLEEGSYELLLYYRSPQEGLARMRMLWSGTMFVMEPIPPAVLSHDTGDGELQRSAQLRHGRELFTRYSCLQCHSPEDSRFTVGTAMPELERDAPSLNDIGSRLRVGWMKRWLEDPHGLRPSAKMPQMNLETGDAADIAAWLASLGDAPGEAEQQAILNEADLVDKGRHLIVLQGCVACHTFDKPAGGLNAASHKTDVIGGDRISLTDVADKWYAPALAEYLRDPSRHYAWTGMPDFGLEEDEAKALAAYLILQDGSGSSDGSDRASEVVNDLYAGDKAVMELGDAQRGRRLVAERGCASCHAAPLVDLHEAPSLEVLSQMDWMNGWLADGARGSVEYNRAEANSDDRRVASAHPQYPSLTIRDREALIALAEEGFGSLKRHSPMEFAARQVTELNCRACHQFDGSGDYWSKLEDEVAHMNEGIDEADFIQQRPLLTWAGEKLQPEWLEGLLAGTNEHRARPWLRARMPAMGAEPALLTRGLIETHGHDGVDFQHQTPDPDLLEHGRILTTWLGGGFGCQSCHHGGDGGGMAAPSLNMLGERIRPEFFKWILHSPRRIDPHSAMPRFAGVDGQTRMRERLDGDGEVQLRAMWHYLVDSRISLQDPDGQGGQARTHWIDLYQKMDVGPFTSGIIEVPDGGIRTKGMAIRVGEDQQAAIHFDKGLLSMSAGWTGKFLKYRDNGDLGIRTSPPPLADGDVRFVNPEVAGWITGETTLFDEPRPDGVGLLPIEQGAYKGMYLNDDRVVISYSVAGIPVLESPWYVENEREGAFVRDLNVGASDQQLLALVLDMGEEAYVSIESRGAMQVARATAEGRVKVAAIRTPDLVGVELMTMEKGQLAMRFSPHRQADRTVRILLWEGEIEREDNFMELASVNGRPDDPRRLSDPGPLRWGEPLVSSGELGEPDGSWAVDQLSAPVENPFDAMMHFTGVDFLDDGRAVLTAMHGDVWIVEGLDDSLKRLEWRRFATGLNMPFGVRVYDGKIYVMNEDELTILHDRNGNGEADYYESFRNLISPGTGGWKQAFGLEVDKDGYFYYARGRGPVNTDEEEGVFRISPDGRQMEMIASGFRQPFGMGISPEGRITVSQQEGRWTPQTPVNIIDLENRKGSFYGFNPESYRREDPYPRELGYEPPILYMPRNLDNSGAGQVWVDSDNWGLPRGEMLHFTNEYGAIIHIMNEQVNGDWQGAGVQLLLLGEMMPRVGRFHPHDQQLYVTGQIPAGGFKRVRYTGKPIYRPLAFHAYENGLRIRFSQPLNREIASDVASYTVHRWNYRWDGEYGSEFYSVENPDLLREDPVTVKSVHVLDGGREIFLEIPDMMPVMQMRIEYDIEAADGTKIRDDLYNTVNILRPPFEKIP